MYCVETIGRSLGEWKPVKRLHKAVKCQLELGMTLECVKVWTHITDFTAFFKRQDIAPTLSYKLLTFPHLRTRLSSGLWLSSWETCNSLTQWFRFNFSWPFFEVPRFGILLLGFVQHLKLASHWVKHEFPVHLEFHLVSFFTLECHLKTRLLIL